VVKIKRGNGTKIMGIADRHGLPGAVCIESASPHEVNLVQRSLGNAHPDAPTHLIGDAAMIATLSIKVSLIVV
jgi:hypothetical protein